MKPGSAGLFARDQSTKRLKQLAARIEAAAVQADVEAVHALRIAIRRLEPVLEVFKPCFDRKPLRKLERRLHAIRALAGRVRDCDIAFEFLSTFAGRRIAGLRARLQQQREEAAARLILELKKVDSLDLTVPDLDGECARATVAAVAHRELAVVAEGFFDSGRRAASSRTSGRKLHRLRIAAKRFRYTLELFLPLYGRRGRLWLLEIRKVQSVLGSFNNHRTVRDIVSGLGGDRSLEEILKAGQSRKRKCFRKLWKEAFPRSVVKHWMQALRRT